MKIFYLRCSILFLALLYYSFSFGQNQSLQTIADDLNKIFNDNPITQCDPPLIYFSKEPITCETISSFQNLGQQIQFTENRRVFYKDPKKNYSRIVRTVSFVPANITVKMADDKIELYGSEIYSTPYDSYSSDQVIISTQNVKSQIQIYKLLEKSIAISKYNKKINDPYYVMKLMDKHKNYKPEQKQLENRIPLKEENGVLSLDVNLNGHIYRFILDSGAGESSMSSELETFLIKNSTIKPQDYLANGKYILADGSTVECKRVNITKILVGNKTVQNIIVSIGPAGSPNLLGQSFLNRISKWSIDNVSKSLIIN
jgi:predicted aspartyl protease